MNTLRIIVTGIALSLLAAAGCEQRFDLSSLPNPRMSTTPGDTTYVELFPTWTGFVSPRAVMIGNDQLIYVCDYGSNEVIMLDAGGSVLARRSIPHPMSIAQNSKLDLYVGAETMSPNGADTIGAIYRISLVRFDTTYVAGYDTVIEFGDTTYRPIIRDTSYFYDSHLDIAPMRIVWQEAARPERRFRGIAILPGNGYLAARYGPDNTSFVDPDCRVLEFNSGDTLITPLGDLVTRPSGGTAITDIRYLTGIMTFPASNNFLVTQSTDGVAYGAIMMTYTSNINFQGWLPTYDPANPTQRGTDIIRPYRFRNAVAAAYDQKRRDVFILDAGLDSVMKFNSKGVFKQESFGRALTSSDSFRALDGPMGIAYSNDCTLYIADTGNKVIRRFKLSIQLTCF